MSNLQQRRDAPRRRVSGGMHPGWLCFYVAFISGMFWVFAGITAARWLSNQETIWPFLITGAIAVSTFMMAGKLAERLRLL